MKKHDKEKLILVFLEGFGISPALSGNAILAANPKNFFEIWQKYNHVLVNPIYKNETDKSLFESKNSEWATIFTGTNVLSDQEYVNSLIETKEFFLNQKINIIFDNLAKRNSNLHLIGNLSGDDGRYGNIEHLIALLNLAKRRKIFRVFVHLVLDDSVSPDPRDALALINYLNKKMSELGVGEIASVFGEKFIDNNFYDLNLVLKAIVNGSGRTFLSAEQAVILGTSKNQKNSLLLPSVITFRGQPVGKINPFDSVIFFNHDNEKMQKLILALSRESSAFNNPKFVDLASFFDPFLQKPEKLKILFERNFSKSICQILDSNDVKQIYIGDQKRENLIKSFQADTKSIKNIYFEKSENILDKMLSAVSQNLDRDFVVLDVPFLYETSLGCSFEKTKDAVLKVDDFLAKLVKIADESKSDCIITSNCAGTEQMFQKNQYEKINQKAGNPLPFVLVSKKSATGKSPSGSVTNSLMSDILKKGYDLVDIAPTILRLLNLNKGPEMIGQSFISHLINEEEI